ncbi:MAG: ATP synthase F1 subunit epsilon [Bacteriovoracaceae bacterium]|nr:ATP synthase F1 subunit epsilon [Bacteriovoracaceae bacterium]
MNYFTVDLLTPEKVVAKDIPAESLLIPTVRGQINILPHHTHLINRLSTGVLSIFGGADDPDRHFSVTYGICKVLEDKVIIMSHTSEEKSEISADRAEQALETAERRLNSGEALSDSEIEKFQRKAERARLRIQLSKQ